MYNLDNLGVVEDLVVEKQVAINQSWMLALEVLVVDHWPRLGRAPCVGIDSWSKNKTKKE